MAGDDNLRGWLSETIGGCVRKLKCGGRGILAPVTVIELEEEDVFAVVLPKCTLTICLPPWLLGKDEGRQGGEQVIVLTGQITPDDGHQESNVRTEINMLRALARANERAERVRAGQPEALTVVAQILEKFMVEIDLTSYDSDDGKSSSSQEGDDKGGEEEERARDYEESESGMKSFGLAKRRRQCRSTLETRAQAAALACSRARTGAGSSPSDATRGSMRWCRVDVRPSHSSVALEFDMRSVIEDRGAAHVLGFDMESPTSIELVYSSAQWRSQSCHIPIPESINVGWAPSRSAPGLPRHGPEMLLKDIVQRYYGRFLGSEGKRKRWGEMLDESENDGNELIGLILRILERLQKLTASCVICHTPFALPGGRIRPCSKELCLFQFEEIGLVAGVLHQVKESPDLVQIELTLANAAANSCYDVFEPFPSFLLLSEEVRSRSGFFSRQHEPPERPPAQGRRHRHSDAARPSDNKQLSALATALEHLPDVASMSRAENEEGLTAIVNDETRETWERLTEPFPSALDLPRDDESVRKLLQLRTYEIFRFVLTSNPLHLRPVPRDDWLPVPNTIAQIAVLSDSPDREQAFLAKAQAGSSSSLFAFHGSSLENWYSIMRNGLRSLSDTGYMRAGASCGRGVYLSTCLGMSMNYAKSGQYGWGDFKLQTLAACAIVEVAPGVEHVHHRPASQNFGKSKVVMVVPKEHEDGLIIRYLLIFDATTKYSQSRGALNIVLTGNQLGDVDLQLHIRRQRTAHAKQQLDELEARRATAGATSKNPAHQRSSAGQNDQLEPVVDPDPAEPAVEVPNQPFRTPGGIIIHPALHATEAIRQEYLKLRNLQESGAPYSSLLKGNLKVGILDDVNEYIWRITLRPALFSEATQADLHAHAKMRGASSERAAEGTPVSMEVIFSGEFPLKPPFLRMVSPRFVPATGHMTSGGSIYMEALTDSGWSAAIALESVLVEVISWIIETEARLDLRDTRGSYSECEARRTFALAAKSGQKCGNVPNLAQKKIFCQVKGRNVTFTK
eukprot:TRINITY_DN2151_c0_g1_i4.p1 TRINITY_DN2151_c0_g1~~TRINITY_DN2151_c0_g1_i4.p1  ORF type:complete len:1043 (+),score=126.80 TRINITY_DN2151_c0_g1_i4:66-3131(+)